MSWPAQAQVEEFQRRGWAIVRGVLSPSEATYYSTMLGEYASRVQQQGSRSLDSRAFGVLENGEAPMHLTGNAAGSQGVEQMPTPSSATTSLAEAPMAAPAPRTAYNINDCPADVADFVTSSRFASIAAGLLSGPDLRLLHFCGLFKPSGSAATPLHQDLNYIPLETDDVISIWIALADIEPDMSPMIFADGSHLSGPLDPIAAARRFPIVQALPMRAGDASLHSGWTVHGALKNTSRRTRQAFGIGYYADGSRISSREGGVFLRGLLGSCFADLRPGDLAAGPANPIVHQRAKSKDK